MITLEMSWLIDVNGVYINVSGREDERWCETIRTAVTSSIQWSWDTPTEDEIRGTCMTHQESIILLKWTSELMYIVV